MVAFDWLVTLPPFRYLEPADQRLLATVTDRVELEPGVFVARAGHRLDHVLVIRRGAVRRHQPGPDVVVEEGELIGGVEALRQAAFGHDHEVLDLVEAYRVPVAVFRQMATGESFRSAVLRPAEPSTGGLTVTANTVAGPALVIDDGATVQEAARLMDRHRTDAVLVAGSERARPGILTGRDLRSRVLASGRGPETLVGEVATAEVETIEPDMALTDALVFLLERDIHHAPIESAGQMRLMLSDHDVLAHYGNDTFSLLRRLADPDPDGLAHFADRVTGTVRGLVRSGVGPGSIGRAVSSLADGLMRSLCRAAEAELGPPPVPYALCAAGSQGRREQTLLTDQDNLLVHGSAADEGWFTELAERVVDGMIAAGIPACSGGYMATNWSGSVAWWRETVEGWGRDPGPESLLDLNVMGDLRVVHGQLPIEEVWVPLREVATSTVLLRRLGAEVIRFRPPGRLSRLFGRDDFDLKRNGLIPIVGLGRLFALELGLPASSTRQRLEAAAEADLISGAARAGLAEGLDFLTGLRLRGQLAAAEAEGTVATVPFDEDDLDPVDRAVFRAVMRTISDVQHATSGRLRLDSVA